MPNLKEKIKYLFSYFLSPKEILFVFFVLFLSLFFFLAFLYRSSALLMTERIKYAGNITEGIIGNLKEPNPYKPVTQADKDLNNILYSSLVQETETENYLQKYELRLADKIDVSNDKSTYKVTLKKDITFSNGSAITPEDIIYSLSNVATEKKYTVEKTEENTLTFKLKKANDNFLENLTYPIIKKDTIFENNFSSNLVTSSFFRVKSIDKDLDGNVNSLVLERYNNGEEKIAYLKNYKLIYFKNEVDAYNAFQKKEIDLLSGVSGNTLSKISDDTNIKFESAPLPNNYAVFLNQNKDEILQDKNLRKALSDIIDRESLTHQVLGNFGIPEKNILGQKGTLKSVNEVIDSLGSSFSFKDGVLYMSTKKASETKKEAVKITLTTIQNKELEDTAKYLQSAWKKIGIQTEIKVIDKKDLNNVVRDRDFEALLFGFSIKSEKDYYSFFSSKERSYPKLNIANYTSRQSDKILDALSGDNSPARTQDLINQLSVEIEDDNPVIILYKPKFVFAHFLDTQIKLPNTIRSEEERYSYIKNWYTDTEKVLNIFNQSKIVDRFDTLLY